MSAVGPILPPAVSALDRLNPPVLQPAPPDTDGTTILSPAPATGSFSTMFGRMVGEVEAKQAAADATTQRVLLGDGSNLHQSVIAMQEASVALSLMIAVRNKVIESYQQIMQMPV